MGAQRFNFALTFSHNGSFSAHTLHCIFGRTFFDNFPTAQNLAGGGGNCPLLPWPRRH